MIEEVLKLNGNKEKNDMYKLQEEAIEIANDILQNRKNFLFIADDVGLGKTYEGLGILFWNLYLSKKENKPKNILIVTPNEELGKKWIRTYERFKKECYIPENKEEVPEINNFLGNPFELLNLKINNKNQVSIIRANRFSNSYNDLENIQFDEEVEEEIKESKNLIQQLKQNDEKYKLDKETLNVLAILNKHLRKFDLVIIDESQNLRGEYATKNRNFNTLFGLKRKFDMSENYKLKIKFEKTILLTATPNHGSKEDINRQIEYFETKEKAKKLTENMHIIRSMEDYQNIQDTEETLYMIRRNRMFDQKSKYHYRTYNAQKAKMNIDEMLTMATIQKNEIAKNGQVLAMRYVDGIENFREQDEKNEDDVKDYERESERTFTINKIKKEFEKNGINLELSHPKIRTIKTMMEEEKKDLLNLEKTLIFVRRKVTIEEIKRELIKIYDKTLDLLVSEELNESKNLIELIEKNLRNEEIVEEELEENVENEEIIESEWLKMIKQKKGEKQTKMFLTKKRLTKNGILSDFWEEDILKMFGYNKKEIIKKEDKIIIKSNKTIEITYEEILNKVAKLLSEKKMNLLIENKRKTVGKTDFSKILNLILLEKIGIEEKTIEDYEKFYFKKQDKQTDLSEMEQISKKLLLEKARKLLQGNKSLWELEEINQKLPTNNLMQREVIKDLIRRNILVGEGMIYLICIYCNLKNKTSNELLKKIKRDNKTFKKRFLMRIESFIENFDDENNILNINYEAYDDKLNIVSSSPVEGCSSANKTSADRIQKCFNTSFFPDVIVSTDVFKEGIDLQVNCSNIIHYGIAWLQGDMEQRIGRIDRYFSKTYREYQQGNKNAKIKVNFIYMENSVDENQVSNIIGKMIEGIKTLDTFYNESASKVNQAQEYDSVESKIVEINEIPVYSK